MKLNHPAMCVWAAAVALTAGQAQAQSIKPGLWELRMTKQVVNGVDQTAQMAAAAEQMKAAMAKLTPEQRKQIAERMAKRRDMMQRHMQERRSLDAPAKP